MISKIQIIAFPLLLSAALSCQKEDVKQEEECTNPCGCPELSSNNSEPYVPTGENFEAVASGAPKSVTLEDQDRDEWVGFSLVIAHNGGCPEPGGTYSVYGVPDYPGADALWGPDSTTGEWHFANQVGTEIVLGGISRNLIVTESAAVISFEILQSGSRTSSFNGEWIFVW